MGVKNMRLIVQVNGSTKHNWRQIFAYTYKQATILHVKRCIFNVQMKPYPRFIYTVQQHKAHLYIAAVQCTLCMERNSTSHSYAWSFHSYIKNTQPDRLYRLVYANYRHSVQKVGMEWAFPAWMLVLANCTHPSNSLNIHNWNFSITYFSSILLLLFDGRKRCFYLPQNRNCNPLKFCCGNGLLSQTCQKDVCFQIICLFHLAKNKTKTTRKRKGWRKNVRVGSTVLNTRLWRANMTFKIHICQK